jgi:small subunit ribosomal protein S6
MVCFRPDLDEESVGALPKRAAEFVTNQGGEVSKENSMGRRHLAYPIRRYREAYYQVVTFTMPAEQVVVLERQLHLDEDVLRHLVIKEGE